MEGGGGNKTQKHQRKGWLLQSRVHRGGSWPFHKMRSMDSTGEKHIVLCTRFKHPATRQSGWGPKVGTGLHPSIPDLGQPQKRVPRQGPPPAALGSASSGISAFLSLGSNCPNLGIVGFLEVQKRELLCGSSLLCRISQLLPPGGGVNSGEKHNLDRAVVVSGEFSCGLRV